MFIFIIFMVILFACYGKRVSDAKAQNADGSYLLPETGKKGIPVEKVFKIDRETGELVPPSFCYECEDYLHCLGYVSEKYNHLNGYSAKRPCEATPLEALPYMGLRVINNMCEECNYPRNCINCPLKDCSGSVQDCQSCDAWEICEGIEIAKDSNRPDMICGFLSDTEIISDTDDNDIPF